MGRTGKAWARAGPGWDEKNRFGPPGFRARPEPITSIQITREKTNPTHLISKQVHLPPVVVDVCVVRLQLGCPGEVCEGQLRVLVRVLAALDEEGGALDQGVDPEGGVGAVVGGDGLKVGEGRLLLLAQDVEGAWEY